MRRRFKGQIRMPKIGYGSNRKTKHMLPNGFRKVLVNNVKVIKLCWTHVHVSSAATTDAACFALICRSWRC